jgi:hypothetical protein
MYTEGGEKQQIAGKHPKPAFGCLPVLFLIQDEFLP